MALLLCASASAYQVVALPTNDEASPTGGGCSLREAINALKNNASTADCTLVGSPGNDEVLLVTFAATYTIGLAGNADDANNTGDYDITENLTITGAGANLSTIDANHLDRVFDVIGLGTTLTLNDLTVTKGQAPNGASNSGAPGGKGGGIRAEGSLTLNRVVVTANNAGNGGSGLNGSPGQNGGQGGDGGGVYSLQFLTVTDSVISANSAGNGGAGGSAGTCATVTNGGTGGFGGFGGGIAADNGGATITGSTITLNMAGVGAAGGCAGTPGTGGHGGSGGGISVSSLSLTNSLVSDNQTRIGGQAGSDGNSGNSAGSGRGGDGGGIYAYSGATIAGSTISGNITGPGNGNAGGNTQTSPGNQGGDGGGALLKGTGSVTDSTFSGNHTGNGALSTSNFGGSGGNGGGLAVPDPDVFAGTGYVVSKSTFSGNFTGKGGNSGTVPGDGGAGGAIFIGSNIFNVRTASVSDSTLTGNSTGAGGNHTAAGTGGASGRGGAIGVGETSTVDLTHLTIAANTTGTGGTGGTAGARSDGGAIGMYSPFNASVLTVKNSIFVSNQPGNCSVDQATLTDGGHNLVEGAPCSGVTPFSTADPLLGPLADNGGATQTRAIADTSPARDAVPATGAGCTATDQRGTTRPQGTACDAGAFEIFVPPPPDTGGGGGGGGTTQTTNDTTQTTQTPTTNTPPPDKTPPVVKLLLKNQKLAKALKKGYICAFSTNELGSASATLGRFAKGKLKVTKAGTQRLVCKFTKKAKKALAKKKKVTLKLKLVVKDAAGNATTKTAKVTLKR